MKLNNFKKKLICWGAGDQAIVLQPIIESLGSKYDIFIDDTPGKVSPLSSVELLSGKNNFDKWFHGRKPNDYGFIVAIGNPYGNARCLIHNYLTSLGITAVNICDHSALLDSNVIIEDGVQIMKGAIVNACSVIGKQVILNTRSTVEHHNKLSDGVEIGPAATLCGRVSVDQYSWVGAGATVLPRVHIEKNCIIGAGAVVTKNIQADTIVAGVPARFINNNIEKE